MPPPLRIADATTARALFAPLADAASEVAEAVYLDPDWSIVGLTRFEGASDAVAVVLRRLVGDALAAGAAHVLLAHNHPSGDTTPSDTDIAFTRRLAQVLALLDMPLADHLIVTRHATLSMVEAGFL